MTQKALVPIAGRCNAHTRSNGKPGLCQHYPAKGRTRCRLHGGASLRGTAHPRFVDGLSRGRRVLRPEQLVHELTPDELKRGKAYQAMPTSKFLAERLALLGVLMDRGVAHGDGGMPAAYGLAIASVARVKLVADRDRLAGGGVIDVPVFVETFEGKTREDFRREHQEHTRKVLESVDA
jgi:hypothetical protein